MVPQGQPILFRQKGVDCKAGSLPTGLLMEPIIYLILGVFWS